MLGLVLSFHSWLTFYDCILMYQVVEVPNVSWEDIGGLENVKRELQEVAEDLALNFVT